MCQRFIYGCVGFVVEKALTQGLRASGVAGLIRLTSISFKLGVRGCLIGLFKSLISM